MLFFTAFIVMMMAVFCVFFGLKCKQKLNITLFLHFLVIKFAHNKKAY